MGRLKGYLAKKPGIVIAFGLAGLLSSFSAGLNLAHGNEEMVLANIVGLSICAFILILGVRELATRKE